MSHSAPLRLFDAASSSVRPLGLRTPGQVSMYVCGPTVYGPAHLGHGRFSLVFDVIRRYLTSRGLEVTYVSNITDVDDKIINRAQETGETPSELSARHEAGWVATMDLLGVLPPTHMPHATAYIDEMITLVQELVARGAAYQNADGVYLRASRVPSYGLLAHQDLSEMRAGARVELGLKEDPTDFVLWKSVPPGELAWDSPWGPGRPGWHTECVAMGLDLLGPGFDLHGGGADLAFPHHENERAQAAALGQSLANHWVHNGFVVDRDSRRMGRSVGNVVDLPTLLAGTDPRAYRLLVLGAHYRAPLVVDAQSLAESARALERLDALAARASRAGGEVSPDEELEEAWHQAVSDDLSTHLGLARIFDAAREANTLLDQDPTSTRARSLVVALQGLLAGVGLFLKDVRTPSDDDLVLVATRDAARRARDWSRSDDLRDQLLGRGWKVLDTPAGTVLE